MFDYLKYGSPLYCYVFHLVFIYFVYLFNVSNLRLLAGFPVSQVHSLTELGCWMYAYFLYSVLSVVVFIFIEQFRFVL